MSAKHISYFSWLSDLFYSPQTSKFILKLCQCNENYQALIALAFAHFSSELLLKEQMIIPVKKTLHNAGHIDAKLISFSEICQKTAAKSAVFYWLFLGEVPPQNFPWNRPIFLRICPWKSFEIWFFCKFWLFSHEIGQFSCFLQICPWEFCEILLFFCEISEALK